MNQIDFTTYWINLDRSIDRKNNMEKFFNKFNIKNERFSGIDGSLNPFNHIIFKDNLVPEDVNKSKLSCLLSHLFVIKNFYEKDPNDFCLILEDDIDFQYFNKYNLDFKKTINKIVRECKNEWEIIQVSFTIRKNNDFKTDPFNLYLNWRYKYYGTIAYIINKNAALKLIYNNFKDNKVLVDLTLEEKKNYYVSDCLLYKQVLTYTYKIPLFSYNPNFESIIGSKEDTLNFGLKMIKDTIQFYDPLLQIYPKNI